MTQEKLREDLLAAYKKQYEGILPTELIESSAKWLGDFIEPYFSSHDRELREKVMDEMKMKAVVFNPYKFPELKGEEPYVRLSTVLAILTNNEK